MTAEVCMMNRLAVVLAADSATTVSRWVDGKKEERYFKGANKIFQLSDHHPVGLMIFDSADILQVPWETVVKCFRTHLDKKPFNTVEEYAEELFSFLDDNPRFFPESVQADQLLRPVRAQIFGWMAASKSDDEDGLQRERLDALIEAQRAELVDVPLAPCLKQELVDKIVADYREAILQTIAEFAEYMQCEPPSDLAHAVETAFLQILKHPEDNLGTTGLVITGFGDHEIFPSMVEYVSCGVVGGKHLHLRKTDKRLDHDNPAWLSAFAQTEMTDTFNLGLSVPMYGQLMVTVTENLAEFAHQVADKSGGKIDAIDDLEGLMQAATSNIGDAVLDKAWKEHSLPLRSVLSVLPVDEMAELAETLITLQSLKEKVTKPSATVGGPVDVAIITKHEGLVWVKRKHFFNSDINSRFTLRQAAKHS
ncbi:hypothetical protein [Ensifer sp. LC163]|uniref:hypothetical protein n=1 Tax=Ensifer sp. LC163 TaxID=1120652 RepID=UPI00081D65D0|nr:hypothetical protein [Ensifer sp. LC163]OCP36731.1 hypothetical protein BC360_05075 [Ensifer sp. LC163]